MTGNLSIEAIVSGVRNGDKRSAAQLMSMVEKAAPESQECLKALAQGKGQSHVVGVTGWPGVGKSTLICAVAASFLNAGKQVGVIAVDPTSPLSGGSFLGDRARMRKIDGDERLFIRSMATRGFRGGIATATSSFVRIMEAMGKEVVIVETVGIGQDQVSVAGVADTLIVTVIPGMGDYLQALKAGIMEMGDIFVVNKADRKGVDQVVMDLTMMRSMNDRQDDWIPPIVKTIAQRGEGVAELMSAIELHRDHIAKLGLASLKRTAAAKGEIVETLKDRCFQFINGRTGLDEKLEQFALQVVNGTIDRHTLVESILRDAGIID